MKASTAQIITINTLLTKQGIDKDGKRELVIAFSNGRETSTKELTVEEARAMIKHFKENEPNEERAARMRGKIIILAKTIGWRTVTGKVDMASINSWCEKYSYLHKKLDSYSYAELPKLVTQFEAGPYQHFLNNG